MQEFDLPVVIVINMHPRLKMIRLSLVYDVLAHITRLLLNILAQSNHDIALIEL